MPVVRALPKKTPTVSETDALFNTLAMYSLGDSDTIEGLWSQFDISSASCEYVQNHFPERK